jgi:hypothetical protein
MLLSPWIRDYDGRMTTPGSQLIIVIMRLRDKRPSQRNGMAAVLLALEDAKPGNILEVWP